MITEQIELDIILGRTISDLLCEQRKKAIPEEGNGYTPFYNSVGIKVRQLGELITGNISSEYK